MSTSFGTFGATFGQLGSGGGVLLPAAPSEIIQWLKGGTTDGLTLLDKKDTVDAPEVRDVNVMSFAGTGQNVESGVYQHEIQRTGVFEIEFWAIRNDTAGNHRILYPLADIGAGLAGWRVQFPTGGDNLNMFISNDGANILNNNFATGVDTTEWHLYKLVGDGSDVELFVDDVSVTSSAMTTGNFGGSQPVTTSIGSTASSLLGKICLTKVDDGSTGSFYYPLQEGEEVPYDVSGNDNHATSTNGVWSTTDGVPSWNHWKGFSLYDFITLTLLTIPALDLIPVLTQVPS